MVFLGGILGYRICSSVDGPLSPIVGLDDIDCWGSGWATRHHLLLEPGNRKGGAMVAEDHPQKSRKTD